MNISLKAKNPFQSGSIELFSLKTVAGIGLFTVLAGCVYAGIKYVGTKAEKATSMIDSMWDAV